MVFKDDKHFRQYLLQKCKIAIAETENKIYQIINDCLGQYYNEFTPSEYIRTQKLLHSLVKSDIKKVGDGYQAEVYFDESRLTYETGIIPTQQGIGWATWGAEEVLDTAMHGSHGGYIDGTAIWGTSMAIIGDVYALLMQKLRTQGVPIK